MIDEPSQQLVEWTALVVEEPHPFVHRDYYLDMKPLPVIDGCLGFKRFCSLG